MMQLYHGFRINFRGSGFRHIHPRKDHRNQSLKQNYQNTFVITSE